MRRYLVHGCLWLLMVGTVVYAKTDIKAVATVNGEAISYAEYEKAVTAVEDSITIYPCFPAEPRRSRP